MGLTFKFSCGKMGCKIKLEYCSFINYYEVVAMKLMNHCLFFVGVVLGLIGTVIMIVPGLPLALLLCGYFRLSNREAVT